MNIYKYKILIIAGFTAFTLFFMSASMNIILNFAHDDSFFYLKIAKNFSDGYFSTFDKISPTNGYHPLYLLVLTLFFWILKILNLSEPGLLYRYTCILHLIIISFTYYFIIAFKHAGKQIKSSVIFIFVLISFCFVFLNDFGTETHLSCLLLSVYLFVKFGNKFDIKRKAVINSIILGFIVLARIDYLITLIPAILIADILTESENNKRFVFFADITAVLIFASAYFMLNLIFFDSFQTSSAAVLNSFPEILFFSNMRFLLSDSRYLLSLTVNIAIIPVVFLYSIVLRIQKPDKFEIILLLALSGLALNILLNLFFNKFNVREWYISVPLFISLVLLFPNIKVKNKLLLKSFIFIAGVFFLLYFIFIRILPAKWENSYNYAKILKEKTINEDLIYQYDYSGAVSFFSERNLINGDGFVNSLQYISKYLQKKEITEFFRENKINYLSTISYDSIRFDKNNNYIFKGPESFLNGFILTPSDLVATFPFNYKHPVIQRNGYWLLFKINH